LSDFPLFYSTESYSLLSVFVVLCSSDSIAWRPSRRHRHQWHARGNNITIEAQAENGQRFYGPYARLSAVAQATQWQTAVCVGWKYALYSERWRAEPVARLIRDKWGKTAPPGLYKGHFPSRANVSFFVEGGDKE